MASSGSGSHSASGSGGNTTTSKSDSDNVNNNTNTGSSQHSSHVSQHRSPPPNMRCRSKFQPAMRAYNNNNNFCQMPTMQMPMAGVPMGMNQMGMGMPMMPMNGNFCLPQGPIYQPQNFPCPLPTSRCGPPCRKGAPCPPAPPPIPCRPVCEQPCGGKPMPGPPPSNRTFPPSSLPSRPTECVPTAPPSPPAMPAMPACHPFQNLTPPTPPPPPPSAANPFQSLPATTMPLQMPMPCINPLMMMGGMGMGMPMNMGYCMPQLPMCVWPNGNGQPCQVPPNPSKNNKKPTPTRKKSSKPSATSSSLKSSSMRSTNSSTRSSAKRSSSDSSSTDSEADSDATKKGDSKDTDDNSSDDYSKKSHNHSDDNSDDRFNSHSKPKSGKKEMVRRPKDAKNQKTRSKTTVRIREDNVNQNGGRNNNNNNNNDGDDDNEDDNNNIHDPGTCWMENWNFRSNAEDNQNHNKSRSSSPLERCCIVNQPTVKCCPSQALDSNYNYNDNQGSNLNSASTSRRQSREESKSKSLARSSECCGTSSTGTSCPINSNEGNNVDTDNNKFQRKFILHSLDGEPEQIAVDKVISSNNRNFKNTNNVNSQETNGAVNKQAYCILDELDKMDGLNETEMASSPNPTTESQGSGQIHKGNSSLPNYSTNKTLVCCIVDPKSIRTKSMEQRKNQSQNQMQSESKSNQTPRFYHENIVAQDKEETVVSSLPKNEGNSNMSPRSQPQEKKAMSSVVFDLSPFNDEIVSPVSPTTGAIPKSKSKPKTKNKGPKVGISRVAKRKTRSHRQLNAKTRSQKQINPNSRPSPGRAPSTRLERKIGTYKVKEGKTKSVESRSRVNMTKDKVEQEEDMEEEEDEEETQGQKSTKPQYMISPSAPIVGKDNFLKYDSAVLRKSSSDEPLKSEPWIYKI